MSKFQRYLIIGLFALPSIAVGISSAVILTQISQLRKEIQEVKDAGQDHTNALTQIVESDYRVLEHSTSRIAEELFQLDIQRFTRR